MFFIFLVAYRHNRTSKKKSLEKKKKKKEKKEMHGTPTKFRKF